MRHCTPVRSRGPYGWTEADDVWAVWQNGLEVFVCVLALRKLCVLIGIDCGLPVDIWWQVGT